MAADLDPTRKKALRRELEGLLGKGAVLSEPDELLVYESDGLTLFRALADFVVFPTSAEHVSAVRQARQSRRACPSSPAARAPGSRAAASRPRAAS